MPDKSDSIQIFTGVDSVIASPDVRRGLRESIEGVASKVSDVAVSTLQENMRRFLTSLDTIMSASPKDVGGLTLDEVEIHAQIDGKGNVGISGVAGAEFAAQGGIKFVLRKKM